MKYICLFLIMLTFLPLVNSAPITLPVPTGTYSVGTKTIEMRDPARLMLKDATPRRWMIQAFYPCNKHQETSLYMPGTIQNGMIEGTIVKTHSKENATTIVPEQILTLDDPALLGQKFPVIFFIPGIGGYHQNYTILCEELASHGYVVLAIGEPYVSSFVKFPDGTAITYCLTDAWKHMRRTDRDYRYQYFDDAMDSTMSDINYMLDHLDQIDQALTQTIENIMINGRKYVYDADMGYPKEMPMAYRNNFIIDQSQLIIMGHSFGGNVAHTLGFKDARIKAVIDIDSKITDRPVHGVLGVPENMSAKPVLFIRGMMQYQEDLGDHLTKVTNATIWQPHVEHGAFTDKAYFAANIKDFGNHGLIQRIFNYAFKTGPLLDATDTNLGGQEINSWLKAYHMTIIDWLKEKLK
ncbi:MAG: hypothetical protein V4482_01730 [Pseudomonadota bacterium]